ncbi:MAG TPA: hypothetical protein VK797_23430 [Tepidisphaeraceae bacterium]|jgi:hypothetical protein|nr:hypothetical protein [Tepidisphaeraceae bacterium]
MSEQSEQPDSETLYVGSLVSSRSGEGVVQFQWGEKTCQLDPETARQVAFQILEAAEASDSDEFVVWLLREKVGLSMEQCWPILIDFREHRNRRRIERGQEPVAIAKPPIGKVP